MSGTWRKPPMSQQQQYQQQPTQFDQQQPTQFEPAFNQHPVNEMEIYSMGDGESPPYTNPEAVTDNNTPNGNENGEKMGELHGVVGGKVRKKKKKTAGEKNLRLKKYVRPKNAVMCLNELIPGIVYNVETDENGVASSTKVSVHVDGIKFVGSGTSKQMAKQDAAEKALVSFVKAPPSTDLENVQEDNTPWAVLACFAMYKLFNKWIGDEPNTAPMVMDTSCDNFQQIVQRQQHPEVMSTELATPQTLTKECISEQKLILSSHLGKPLKDCSKVVPNPAKLVPDNAGTMHPMMLLHQMRPGLQLAQTKFVNEEKQQLFKVTATIDDQPFAGEGKNMKKAKYDMAVKANKLLFDVDCTYIQPT